MPDDPKAKAVLDRHAALKAERSAYERTWQDVRDLVRPMGADFNRPSAPGSTRTEAIYDDTAVQANEDFASALQANLTNPSDRWFALETEHFGALKYDRDALEWLDAVSDILYDAYANPESNHQSTLHENYLDIGAFGTAVQFQELSKATRQLVFRAYPLADCHISENNEGRVDTVHRSVMYTLRQMVQEFGEEAIPDKLKDESKKDTERKYEIIHCVYPRKDRMPYKADAGNKKYASLWVLKEYCHVLKESGFDSFPYHVPRWEKLAGEVYGRSPAIKCLPSIRVLNRMVFTVLKAGQKAVDPPMIVANDGFLLPIKTAPGSLIFKEPGAEEIQTLESKGNFPIAFEMLEQSRESIRKSFYSEWVKLEIKKERQTAYEIAEMREQQLQMIAPMLGRIASELLNPMIARSYQLLVQAGRIPPAPESIADVPLKVRYVSPAARAQKAVKAISIGRFMQEVVPVVQVKPDIIDAIDFDAAVQKMALAREVDPEVVRSPEMIEAIRAKRAEAEQLAQAAEIAKPMSEAYKNIAQAQQQAA